MPVKRSRTRIEAEPAVWAWWPGPEDRGGSVSLEETPGLRPGAVPPEAPPLVVERGLACAWFEASVLGVPPTSGEACEAGGSCP